MDLQTTEVYHICRDLLSDKGPERRKAAVKLKTSLARSSVKKALDKNHEAKQTNKGSGRFFTWENVFKAVIGYIAKETDELRNAKDGVSKGTMSNRETRKLDASALFKCVVREADKGSPKLKALSVITYIKETLRDCYTCDAYGQDCCSILLNNVLATRKYITELGAQDWQELLSMFCKLFLDTEVKIDRLVLARILHALITCTTKQCDIRPKKLLSFFTEYFKKAKEHKSCSQEEHMMQALNVFVSAIAPSSRVQICKLGEEIVPSLCYLWRNVAVTEQLKDSILEFLQIQMWCHHAKGDKQGQTGAYAMDWDKWMSHLRKLYELMYMEIQQMGTKARNKGCVLKQTYVKFAADVCNQVFTDASHTIDVTQLSSGASDTQGGSGAKRRRLESGWSAMRDLISAAGQSVKVIPFLQLVTRLLQKYTASLDRDELVPYLTCLAHIMAECKRPDLMTYILRCLQAFASHWSVLVPAPADVLHAQCKPVWAQIWSAALRYVSLHHAEAEGYKLLSSMVVSGLVGHSRDIWSLFVPSVSVPVTQSVQFLCQYLLMSDFPERHIPNLVMSVQSSSDCAYPLRKQLIDWLLPARDFDSEFSKPSYNIDADWSAHALVALTLRNPAAARLLVCEENSDAVSELEQQYLDIELDMPIAVPETGCIGTDDGGNVDLVHIAVMLREVETALQRDVEYYCGLTQTQMSDLEEMVGHVCVVARVIEGLLHYQIYSPTTISSSSLVDSFSKLLKKFSTATVDVVKQEGCVRVQACIEQMRGVFRKDGRGTDRNKCVMAALCRSVTPSQLIDLMLDITFEKGLNKRASSTQMDTSLQHTNGRASTSHGGRSRLLDDSDDEFNMDFDDDDVAVTNNNSVDDLDMGDGDESSQDSGESTATSKGCENPLSPSVLSESQCIQLAAVALLCQWCGYDRNTVTDLQVHSEVDVIYIRSKVISLLDESTFNPHRPVDIQMLKLIVTNCTSKHDKVADKDVETMLAAIRQVVRSQRKDQDVCRTSLFLLELLVPHLCDEAPSRLLQECRDSALQLIDIFWKLQDEASYPSETRKYLARLMERLLQYDPGCEWARFPEEEDSSAEGAEPADRLIEYASDNKPSVRMFVASAIHRLFVHVDHVHAVPVDRQAQEKVFEKIYRALSDSLDIQVQLSPERLEDEQHGRTASVLTTLASVICSSPVCEKKAVFTLIKLTREKGTKRSMIGKILQKVSGCLGYKSSINYVESLLVYLINKWLGCKFPVAQFPYQLLECDSVESFYRKYVGVIVPELMAARDLDSVKAIGDQLGEDHQDLVQRCIPHIVIHILPLFAASKLSEYASEDGVRKGIHKATTCYKLLTELLTLEVVERQIVSNIDDIVINVLLCLYDTDSDSTDIRNTSPEPNPPLYSSDITRITLDYITRSFSGGNKTLIEILTKTPDSIQKILLELSVRLYSSHRVAEKRRILSMYELFTRLLLKQFHTQLGGAWAYILRDVIVRLTYLIGDMLHTLRVPGLEQCCRENVMCMSLELLREVCVIALETCAQELMKYLPLIINILIPVVEEDGDVGKLVRTARWSIVIEQLGSLCLLKFLVLEKAGALRTEIAKLDSFPDKPVFTDFRKMHQKLKYAAGPFTLRQEVEHFLNQSNRENVHPEFRVEALRYLHGQLKTHSSQLPALTQGGLLCQIVCELVRLSRCSVTQVALEAARCLGEVGPVDLCTNSLPSHSVTPGLDMALQCFEDLPEVQKYCKIFHGLNGYLTDKDLQLVQCVSSVLKQLLSVKLGLDFSTRYQTQLRDAEFLMHYLHPFRASRKKPLQIDGPARSWDSFQSTVDDESLWNPQHSNHGNWIIHLTNTLIKSGAVRDEILRLLAPVCLLKVPFCEMILPFLVHDVLANGDADHREVLSRQVDNFFSCHCGQTSSPVSRCQSVTSASLPAGDEYVCMNVDSMRTMIDMIEYLRHQPRPQVGRQEMTVWDNNFWLEINYLQVATAAQYCSAHFTTMLYAEIWCDVQRDERESRRGSQQRSQRSQSYSEDTRIDVLSDTSTTQSGVTVQDLLLEAYCWIGEPDGVYGCGAGKKADTASRIRTYEHENQWDKAVISCDIQMSQSASWNQFDLLRALQNFGVSHISDMYLQGLDVDNERSVETRELQYQAAWRIGQWDIDTPNKLTEATCFHEAVYKAMRAVKEDNFSFAEAAVDKARLRAVLQLKEGCLDSARRLYPVLADLQCVAIVDNLIQASRCKTSFSGVYEPPKDVQCDFEFMAPPLFMICSALKLSWDKSKDRQVFTRYVQSLHQLVQTAREAGRHQIAERAISHVKMLDVSDLALALPGQIEEARVYWSRGEHTIAKHLMKTIMEKLRKLRREDRTAAKYYPQSLSIYGNWLAETRSENPTVIMEKYLEKTVHVLAGDGVDNNMSMDAYLALGRYADNQYQNIVNYMKSNTFEAKQSLMKQSQREAERLRGMGESTKDRYLRTLEKQSAIDANELETMRSDRTKFLVKAVENYVKCLRSGDMYNLRVFRLTSLWFNNANEDQVSQLIQDGVRGIKTYKWLPLMYQLAARMELKPNKDTSQAFLNCLNKLIYDTAVQHPHHTLSCVLALANANRDTELLQQGRSKRAGRLSKSQADTSTEEGRVQAAKNMIARLRQDGAVGNNVKELESLSDAYIQLANWNVSQYKKETKPIQLPSALWIAKVKDLKNVPVPTRDIKVDPSGTYENIAYIQKFDSTFKLAGGINLPKIISCLGSDGVNSRQLVKGRDDLRQDAVMQQVFGMVNNLLSKDTQTRKRQLNIRQYKVIPLSQRSGVLEWCEGTQPIGEYLIASGSGGVKGAHLRYRPRDWTASQCREQLAAAAGLEGKLKAFEEICAHFQPVFRHFFLEKFPAPSLWFERRLAYTKSVATNSIVGYILGLGDRHVQNILVDCHTAELVHIDLGVAFEQGEILPTPETVPFRLTRDVEDGMGASGVEGVFRRCCEKTLEVMRSNQEAVLTILEVLLYDPLHAWTISPAKAFALQQNRDQDTVDVGTGPAGDIMDITENSPADTHARETQENVNKLAERVLLRLRQKLQGVEDGVQLSLSGQVNHLIQEARNPANLSRLFPGWQPYI